MYDQDVILKLIENAREIVNDSKQKYKHLMKTIEEFIHDNDIYVKEIKDYFFDLYTFDMFKLPMELTNLLYDTDPNIAKYVSLEIKIYKYHSRISIDGIYFVYFTYVNSEIKKNLLNYYCKGLYTNNKIKCMGPEIMLISIYADLVNPSMYKQWKEIYVKENKLSSEIIDNLKSRINEETVGAGIDKSLIEQMYSMYFSDIKLSTKSLHDDLNNDFTNIILNNFLNNDSHILIGNCAYNIYMGINILGRIQIITSRKYNEEIDILKGLLGNSIYYAINNLKIPTNFNITKMTVYYENKPLLDLIDIANYETINYVKLSDITNISGENYIKKDVNIGTPFTILRFILTDIWYIMYNINSGNLSKEKYINIVYVLITEYVKLRSIFTKFDINLLFSTKYIGFFEDPLLNKQRIMTKLKIKYIPPYMPLTSKKN